MPSIELLWIVSRDPSLGQRMGSENNVLQAANSIDLYGKPTAIIFDPDGTPLDTCRREVNLLADLKPPVPILILSDHHEREVIIDLLGAGAKGYLLKSESDLRIQQSLYELIKGATPVSAQVSSILVESFKPSRNGAEKYKLKDSEIELLQLLSEGMTKKEISHKFKRSVHTVDNHVRQIYFKMEVNNLGQAIGEAFRAGVIS